MKKINIPLFLVFCLFTVALKYCSTQDQSSITQNNNGIIPAIPYNLDIEVPEVGTIILSWDSIVGAESYNIFWKSSNDTDSIKKLGKSFEPQFSHENLLTDGTEYCYRVTAVNTSGESDYSEFICGTPSKPKTPDGLSIEGGKERLRISWNHVENAEYYNIYWKIGHSVSTSDNNFKRFSSPYVLKDLENGTTYCFRITAVGGGPESKLSKEACGITTPGPPEAIEAMAGDTQISVKWVHDPEILSYNIYYSDSSPVNTSDNIISDVNSPYIHTGLTNGTTYYYIITAINSTGESNPSDIISAESGGFSGYCNHGSINLDPQFNMQWHLESTGQGGAVIGADANVRPAWEKNLCLGTGITVAIIDDGVDLLHPDFSEPGKLIILNGSNFNDGDPNSPQADGENGDAHGTACAGVAVASDDGNGTIGAAPNAKLIPIRLIAGLISSTDESQAFYLASNNNADILSNSWGPGYGGGNYPIPGLVDSTIKNIVRNGRSGKGAIFTWAAGNDNTDIDCHDGPPCDGYSSHPNVLAVAATDDQDGKSYYSSHGESIFISAPSSGGYTTGIWTTDHTGSYGYSSGDYTGTFGGTSSATPLVAGVIALILSARPDLTNDQVCWILKNSAETDLYTGTYPFNENGHSIAFGYGKVDAGAALHLLGSIAPGSLNCSTNLTPKYNPLPDIGAPTNFFYINKNRRIYLKLRDKQEDPFRDKKSTINKLKDKNYIAVSYSDSTAIMYLTDYITIGFEEKLTTDEREKLFSDYQLKEIRELALPNSWLVKGLSSIPTDSLFISVELTKNERVSFAEPDLLRHMEKR